MSRLEEWLGPQLGSPGAPDSLSSVQIADALLALLDWTLPRDLSRLAPKTWTTPVGREVDIDYAAEGDPGVECKVQEAFGLATHPAIADGRIALTVAWISPAFRPVALTRDVPGFWRAVITT